ncbi:hypothetical protein ATETN484_0001009000 [Aspergillus terreus]|nr:hypothetical protein ATETN484_0001009000 [Aspergillus terreus]
MTDPLAIASGIAGLLSLGIQVTHGLVKFYATYKDRDTDLEKITRNLASLLSIFRLLDVAVNERRSQADTQDLLREVEKAVRDCEETIAELQSECEKFHKDSTASLKDRVRVAGRRAAYPFRKSTLQKLEEDVSEIRENLSFALDVLQLKSHSQIEDSISEIKALVERTNACQVSFTIRSWLGAPDASANHNATCAKRTLETTGMWFVNGHHFRKWLRDRNSFLWMNGFAGCGKSVLCSTAIQHTFREMRQKQGISIAFFYFSFDEEAKQDINGMLRALLLQLSGQLPDGERYLEQLYALHRSGSPPVQALLDCLRSFLERFRDTYILLDALDESPPNCKREQVLGAIQVMRDWSIPGLHLLVSSRNLVDIRKSLRPSCDEDLPLRNSEIDTDIVNFVTDQLENDAKLQKWKDRHHEIEAKLTAAAQGVFRYVECQFNALRRAKNRNQLDECLRTLPRDLDETYKRILCSIDSDYVEDVRRVLTVLCYARRPVTVEELIDAHAVDLGEPPRLDRDGRSYEQDDLVDICLGLIEIASAKNDNRPPTLIVRIAHFSVQEYLQSDRILQQNLRIFAMQTLSREPSDETKLTLFPFAHFAAMHWFHHYSNSGEGMRKIEPFVLKLFQAETMSFVTWIRLHDMDRPRHKEPDYDRPMTEIAPPVYYAALLGLEFVLNSILRIYTENSRLSAIVNAQGGFLGNALHAAAFSGHENVVQMLLDRGADINAQGGPYSNALQAASSKGHENIVQLLLNQGADINAQGGFHGNALHAASFSGYENVVQMLLDRGADINAQGGPYSNALQAASSKGHENIVQMLLDRGANINAQGGFYGNALHAASFSGHENVVQMLLDRGADINAQGGPCGNALQAASYRGQENIVQMLLDRGADINAQGGPYGNALQAASSRGHQSIVQMLLDHGADINV